MLIGKLSFPPAKYEAFLDMLRGAYEGKPGVFFHVTENGDFSYRKFDYKQKTPRAERATTEQERRDLYLIESTTGSKPKYGAKMIDDDEPDPYAKEDRNVGRNIQTQFGRGQLPDWFEDDDDEPNLNAGKW
jgi:hypothetical protein